MAEGRPLPYPNILGAQMMQFPYRFYYQNNWLYRALPIGLLVCIPIFYKIQVASKKADMGNKNKKD